MHAILSYRGNRPYTHTHTSRQDWLQYTVLQLARSVRIGVRREQLTANVAATQTCHVYALCGLRGCKNRPAPFPGWMSYKATKPGSVVHILACFILYCCLLGPPFILLVFVAVCLLVVLAKLSVLSKWLARKTPLRKPHRARGSSPESPGWRAFMIVFVYCYVYVYVLCVPRSESGPAVNGADPTYHASDRRARPGSAVWPAVVRPRQGDDGLGWERPRCFVYVWCRGRRQVST